MNINDLKKISLPDEPGVYIFKKGKEILYIGKATSLKNRVRSYFTVDLLWKRGPKIVDMVERADKIDFIKTDSVLEALILESNLIKKFQPISNTLDKDDKSYNYVVFTKEEFPKLIIERKTNIDFVKLIANNQKLTAIYGPFTNGGQLKIALKILRKIFPFLDDKTKSEKGYSFYKEINLAPDIGNASAKKGYAKIIRNLKLFFAGKKSAVLKNFEKEMKNFAKKHEFEKAGEVKEKIFALKHINDISIIKDDLLTSNSYQLKAIRIEAYDIAHISGTNTVGVMTVIENGMPNKNEYRKFKIKLSKQNDIAGLEEILTRRLNHPEWKFPDIIVVDGGVAQKNATEKILADNKTFSADNPKPEIIAVTKDDRHRPKTIQGLEKFVNKYKREILLANSEAHRFAITYHREKRRKSSLL